METHQRKYLRASPYVNENSDIGDAVRSRSKVPRTLSTVMARSEQFIDIQTNSYPQGMNNVSDIEYAVCS